MSKRVELEIDGKNVEAKEGMTILQAAELVGIEIPKLCYHKEMEPHGVCRICIVEINRHGRNQMVASCCYLVENKLKVKTRSRRINRIRKTILELAAINTGADVSGRVSVLAYEYDASLPRFASLGLVEPTGCLLCGLCVERCVEAQWDNIIDFVGRGVNRRIVVLPGREGACLTCSHCVRVCPTARISSANLTFPSANDVFSGRE